MNWNQTKKSGYGRYDYMILSRDKNKPTLIFEFKVITDNDKPEVLEKKLKQAAQKALEQIEKQNYFAKAKQSGSTNIIKIGLAFCGKRFKLCHS